MDKKRILLLTTVSSVVAVAGTVIFANGGANHLDAFAVKADPTEYSVTFDASDESTTVEDKYGQGNCAICTTTPRGAKVGVRGLDNSGKNFTFKGYSFACLMLFDTGMLQKVGAYGFSTITGFAISFSGGSVGFDGNTYIDDVVSGHEYTGLSNTSADSPQFFTSHNVIVTSLTIWYSCQRPRSSANSGRCPCVLRPFFIDVDSECASRSSGSNSIFKSLNKL